MAVCSACYDVLVDLSSVTASDVTDALTVLYAACNAAVANKRMKTDEVKEIAHLKDSTEEFGTVIEALQKAHDYASKVSIDDTSSSGGGLSGLNRNSSSTFSC